MNQPLAALKRDLLHCLEGIDLMLARGFVQPALILIYSTIDAAAALERPSPLVDVRRTDFTTWVERYLLPHGLGHCTALDLYGARCGVLHTFSAASGLSRSGHAARIGYALLPATSEEIEVWKRIERVTDLRAVQLETLRDALSAGLVTFLEEVARDQARLALVLQNCEGLFGFLPVLESGG